MFRQRKPRLKSDKCPHVEEVQEDCRASSLSGTKPPLHLQGLEKMNKRRDLQQQLMEAKLQQAEALLTEAQEKHKREKEYVSMKGRA